MTIVITPTQRKPLNELDFTVSLPWTIDLSRLMVPHMDISCGSLGEMVWVGEVAEHIDGIQYPPSPVDLYVAEGRIRMVTTAIFGEVLMHTWAAEQLINSPIMQLPIRRCA